MPTINSSSDEAEFGGDGSNDEGDAEEVIGGSRSRRSSRGSAVTYNEDDNDNEEEEEDENAGEDDDSDEDAGEDDDGDDDDDDDDDDDIPLSALKSASPAKKKKVAAKAKAKPKTKAKAKKPVKKKAKTTATKITPSGSSNDTYSSPSFALYGTDSSKGQLIQKLLCRWWYAISWPDPSCIPKTPPKNYDTMDGFPGVYICTHGDEVGTIKDFRDKSTAPHFNNFAKMTSEELRDLLIKAINEQKTQLSESEGTGTSTEKELNSMLKWATKLNVKKADKDAEKVLKANKLSIPE